MIEFLVLLFFETQDFCKSQQVHEQACVTEVMECMTVKEKDFCKKEFWNYYSGI